VLWYNLRYSPGIILKELRKGTKNISQNSRSSSLGMNLGSPEYVNHMTSTFRRRCRLEDRRMYLRKIGLDCTSISLRFLKSEEYYVYKWNNHQLFNEDSFTIKLIMRLGWA
jgi:hypothetical protein